MGVEYEDAALLMEDLRVEGFHNLHPQRRRTLTGRGRVQAVCNRLEAESPVRVTWELLFGFATAPLEKSIEVRVDPPARQCD